MIEIDPCLLAPLLSSAAGPTQVPTRVEGEVAPSPEAAHAGRAKALWFWALDGEGWSVPAPHDARNAS